MMNLDLAEQKDPSAGEQSSRSCTNSAELTRRLQRTGGQWAYIRAALTIVDETAEQRRLVKLNQTV